MEQLRDEWQHVRASLLSDQPASSLRPGLMAAGGRSVMRCVEGALDALERGNSAATSNCTRMCQQLAWEKLHTGNWKDVPMVWRDLYGLSCLLLALAQLQQPLAVAAGQQQQQQRGQEDAAAAGAPPIPGVAAAAAAAAATDVGLAAIRAAAAAGGSSGRGHSALPGSPAAVDGNAAAAAAAAAQGLGQAAADGSGQAAAAVEEGSVSCALRELDMAAIMGGGLVRPLVDRLAAASHAYHHALYQQQQWQWQWQRQRDSGGGDRAVVPAPGPAAVGAGAASHRKRARGDDERLISQQPPPLAVRRELSPPPPPQQQQPGLHRLLGSEPAEPVPLPRGSLPGGGFDAPVLHRPSLERFLHDVIVDLDDPGRSVPTVITGCMACWPALERWPDPSYLLRVAGGRTVPVEVGRNYLAAGWGQRLMTLRQFVERHLQEERDATEEKAGAEGKVGVQAEGAGAEGEEEEAGRGSTGGGGGGGSGGGGGGGGGGSGGGVGVGRKSSGSSSAGLGYLAQHELFDQIPELRRDICVPDYCYTLGEGQVQSINAWFGPAGTVTPLHTDPHHNLLAQAVGRKYVRLYSPACGPHMYAHASGLSTNSSRVDLDEDPTQSAARFPGFFGLPFVDAVLAPGQMLYIPPGWWHYCKSLSASFSVSFWWK